MITSYNTFINESRQVSASDCEIYQFRDWDEFKHKMNEIGGWDNQTLFKTNRWKHDNNKRILGDDYKEPNEKGCTYIGFLYKGKFVGYTSIYIEKELVWIGDFEIFKNITGKGFGRTFFDMIKAMYPKREFELTFGSRNAMLFWQKMGFERVGKDTKLMIMK